MSRLVYTMSLYILLPFVCLRLWRRGKRDSTYRLHWQERFGLYTGASANDILWLHAVSVGETRAAEPLVYALLSRYPDASVLLTCMTPTGRATGEQLFAGNSRVIRAYLPYDYPFAIRCFLEHFRPRIGVLLETELWPNLITLASRQFPVALVNARLSEKSARRYARWPALVYDCLARLHAIAAQTMEDAMRLSKLAGIDASRIQVTGNLKFDIAVPDELVLRGKTFKGAVCGRPVLLCASTREGEEPALLDAFTRARNTLPPDVLLVIVPRHPQRFAEVEQEIVHRGLSITKRSALADGATISKDISVLLGDSMGEMFAYYAMADAAYIGGSLMPYGGQNLIEACAVGTPALIGPHTYNFTSVSELAIRAGAAIRVADYDALMAAAAALFSDSARRSNMRAAGLAFCQKNQGATLKTLTLLQSLIR